MKKFIIILALMATVVCVQAQPMPIGNKYYQPYIEYNNTGLRLAITSYEDHTAKVLAYNGPNGDLTIPEQFEYEGENFTITEIEGYTFYGYCSMQQITLPNTITKIGSYAFFSSRATIMNIPDSLEYIGDYAFSGTRTYVFRIPAKTRYIAPAAFSQNRADIFVVDSLNPYFTAVDGVLYTKDTLTLVAWPDNRNCSVYTVPEGVRRIEAYALDRDCRISNIILPNSLREIGARALEAQVNTTIHIPGGVCRIEGNPVCDKLVALDSLDGVPNQHYRFDGDRLVSMDGDTLISWNNVTGDIIVPQGIKVIAPECFANRGDITSILFPEGLTTLGNNSVQGSLCHINLPSTVRHIGRCACEEVRMDSLILPEGITEISPLAFGGSVINGVVRFPSTLSSISDSMMLQMCFGSLEFSEGLEEIGIDAFAFSRSTTGNQIFESPSTLRRICRGAFGLSSFRYVYFTGDIDTIGAQLGGSPLRFCKFTNDEPPALYYGFLDPRYIEEIQVPCGSLDTYSNADGEWDKIADSLFVENCESIATAEENQTYLMPNPASETVTVASSFRIADIEVFTLDGRSLMKQRVDGISTTLDISQLPTGTYIVRITTDNGTAYKKLVVK